MNPFADFEKTDISNVVINEDYFKSFEDNEDHMLLDMDSLVQRKDEDVLLTRIDDSTKKCPFEIEPEEEDCLGWHMKPVEEWSQTDTTNWLMSAAQSIGLTYAQTPTTLALPGKDLLALGRSGFHASDPLHGDRFYEVLQNDLAELQYKRDFPGRSAETFQKLSISEDEREQTNVGSNNVSDAESDNSIEISTKRPPGRPRLLKTKKNPTSQGKLWEFIRDLLRNRKTCPSLICWEDYSQAKFRFVRSDEVAKLWGSRKGNTKMTYEKLSRAMRYYYKRKIFLPVLGRRLVYQFGPNATGWQTDNPNFRF